VLEKLKASLFQFFSELVQEHGGDPMEEEAGRAVGKSNKRTRAKKEKIFLDSIGETSI